MKPKEFDELVRQKFEQNDFEYNPRNWEKLESEMDGRSKKRSMMLWWWMPLAGIAASVAIAMGVSILLHPNGRVPAIAKNTERAIIQTQTIQGTHSMAQDAVVTGMKSKAKTGRKRPAKHATVNSENLFSIKYQKAFSDPAKENAHDFNFMNNEKTTIVKKEKRELRLVDAVKTFTPEAEIKQPKTSLILSGGVNHGILNSGYMAGGTVRRMLTGKLYVESDVAFTSSNNSQSIQYYVPAASVARHPSTAKSANIEGGKADPPPTPTPQKVSTDNVSYNLNYVQVTPGLGYKVMNKMSVGIGPDFQQMVADNRPTPSNVERGNIQVDPVFDIGVMGKTEYSVTKNIKAGIYYRKGVNNAVTFSDKYIDHDYLQFQLKCTIFNK